MVCLVQYVHIAVTVLRFPQVFVTMGEVPWAIIVR